MLLRIAAVLGGLLPAVVPWFSPTQWATVVGLSTAAIGLVVLLGARQRGLALIGVALAAVSTLVGQVAHDLLPVTGMGGSIVQIDLRETTFPDAAPRFARVQGFFRDQWLLDEYAVADGSRPDQSKTADAVLVPFVGTQAEVVELDGPVVVARVAADAQRGTQPASIEGRVEPLPDALLGTLVAVVAPGGADVEVRGVLVDTLQMPSASEAWTRVVLWLLLAGGSVGSLWMAARSAGRQ